MGILLKTGLCSLLILPACADTISGQVEEPEEPRTICYFRYDTTREELDNRIEFSPEDIADLDRKCIDYNYRRAICQEELLPVGIHSFVYSEAESQCAFEGELEDLEYEEIGLSTRDAFRGPFIQNNPLSRLRELAPLEFKNPDNGMTILIKPKEDQLLIYEITGGSEFVDTDFVAFDEYRRTKTYGEVIDRVTLQVSRLTARGECSPLFSDIARLSAIGIRNVFHGGWLSTFNPEKLWMNMSVRWIERDNGNFVFETGDQTAWTSGQYLIQVFYNNADREQRWQYFSNELLVDLLHHNFPSDISMDDYDEMLAALFTFRSHRTKLLTESCIPDDEFDALEPGIYFQNGDVVYTEDFFEEN